MRLSLNLSLAWLGRKLEDPALADLLDNHGLHAPRLSYNDSGIALSIRHGGGRLAQRVKFKVALAAKDGALLLDLRDAKLLGISIGSTWLEKLLPEMDLPGGWRIERSDDAIAFSHPAVNFLAAGIDSGNIVIILEV